MFAIATTATAKPNMLDKVDTNKDGQVQYSEFLTAGNQKFAEMDADRNGLVTKDERYAFGKAKRAQRAQKRFAKLDANGDGFVSNQEFTTAQAQRADKKEARRKKRMDANKDGVMDQADHDLRKAKRQARKEKRKTKRQAHKRKRDLNGDGMLSLSEHQAAGKARFDRIDADNNGVLDAQEIAKMKKQRKRGKRAAKRGGTGR